jgi:hypothetical protein
MFLGFHGSKSRMKINREPVHDYVGVGKKGPARGNIFLVRVFPCSSVAKIIIAAFLKRCLIFFPGCGRNTYSPGIPAMLKISKPESES